MIEDRRAEVHAAASNTNADARKVAPRKTTRAAAAAATGDGDDGGDGDLRRGRGRRRVEAAERGGRRRGDERGRVRAREEEEEIITGSLMGRFKLQIH